MKMEASNMANPKKAIQDLIKAKSSGDKTKIVNAMYSVLQETTDMLELVTSYIFLNELDFHIDFGNCILKKGTRLYRIRSYVPDTDFSKANEWDVPPSKPENRANHDGQPALYLGSSELICLLETHIENGQKYVLGTYECLADIVVGGFLSFSETNSLHNIAGGILNAFLIAPARGKKILICLQFSIGIMESYH